MSEPSVTIPTLDHLLEQSAATAEFIESARALEATRKLSGRIRANAGAPPVKVQRVIMQLLESHPDWAIDAVEVHGQSGCSDFRGSATVALGDGSTRELRFVWDCAWKATEEGWKSFWGDPDQQRAAREFGYRCFETFEAV